MQERSRPARRLLRTAHARLAVLALVAASCGGGGSSDPPTGPGGEPGPVPLPEPAVLDWDEGNWNEVLWQ